MSAACGASVRPLLSSSPASDVFTDVAYFCTDMKFIHCRTLTNSSEPLIPTVYPTGGIQKLQYYTTCI